MRSEIKDIHTTSGNGENPWYILNRDKKTKDYMFALGGQAEILSFKEYNIEQMDAISEGVWSITYKELILEHKIGAEDIFKKIITQLFRKKHISHENKISCIPFTEKECKILMRKFPKALPEKIQSVSG